MAELGKNWRFILSAVTPLSGIIVCDVSGRYPGGWRLEWSHTFNFTFGGQEFPRKCHIYTIHLREIRKRLQYNSFCMFLLYCMGLFLVGNDNILAMIGFLKCFKYWTPLVIKAFSIFLWHVFSADRSCSWFFLLTSSKQNSWRNKSLCNVRIEGFSTGFGLVQGGPS